MVQPLASGFNAGPTESIIINKQMITTELSVGAWSDPSKAVLQHPQNFSTVRIILLRFWSLSMSSGPAWQIALVSGSAHPTVVVLCS
jgi:hypothetical protein